ncbi:hypothetical protein AK812_SmicGene2546 [Symbiodinium microadriaticum]|uniref:Uncharacterized protein n=1 Tax=Symbiodinium microadriaticum TaxID=2951 RepID=A0A1Q9F1C6_SYMMI|nr:hypothetical protein AK812_SmicGene2546 [Symbiodinium microadriaticum]
MALKEQLAKHEVYAMLWFFYDNVFLPLFRPLASMSDLRMIRLAMLLVNDVAQVVLERLVEMLAFDRPFFATLCSALSFQPGCVYGRGWDKRGDQVGVFMGETCASLLAKHLPLETVHLVDLWDNNPTYQGVLREKSHLGDVSANEAGPEASRTALRAVRPELLA